MEEKSLAPALTRGLKLLELIVENRDMGFNEMMKELSLNAVTLNRLLKVLIDENYIVKNYHGRYMAGIKCALLCKSNSLIGILNDYSNPILKELSIEFQVSCLMIVFQGSEMICINKKTYPDNVVLQEIGTIDTDYGNNPWGILFLSHRNDKERNLLLSQNSIKNSRYPSLTGNELDWFIQQAVKNHYCDDMGKIILDVRRLAIPVYNPAGELIAALGIGSTTGLLNEDKVEQLLKRMYEKVNLLEELINNNYK